MKQICLTMLQQHKSNKMADNSYILPYIASIFDGDIVGLEI